MKNIINSAKKTRFDARLTVDQKKLFERAAIIAGYSSLSDFIILTVQNRAREIIKEKETVIASLKDAKVFFEAIMNPSPPSKTLKDAAKKYKLAKNETQN